MEKLDSDVLQEGPSFFEMLSVEEFASRMGISRSTVFVWIKDKKLKPRKHFIKNKRVLRIIWNLQTVRALHDGDIAGCEDEIPFSNSRTEDSRNKTKGRKVKSQYGRKTSLNLKY